MNNKKIFNSLNYLVYIKNLHIFYISLQNVVYIF